MLVFLNSAGSTKNALNENHGRELLELHTVGVKAGYTEHMVVDSARVLTGYHVETWQVALIWSGPRQLRPRAWSPRAGRWPRAGHG